MTPAERLHRNDKLWGAVGEALVAAYPMISAGGKLTSYRPDTDVDGKDIIIDLAGGFRDLYAQVKCTTGVNRNHRFGGTVRLRTRHVVADPKFVYIPNGMVQFNFDCLVSGDKKWSEFEVTRHELGPRLVRLIIDGSRTGRRPRDAERERVTGPWLRLVA